MFERYESNFNLDLWERINTNSIPEWLGETAPVGIEKTISRWNRKLMNESFEFEGKVYDSLEDVYHVGTAREFDNARQFLKMLDPRNLKITYKKEKDYPLDGFIEFIDPKTLKRIAFMVVYTNMPFAIDRMQGEKPIGKLILFKGKAFAAEILNKKARLQFMINNQSDIDAALKDKSLRINWHWEPRKTLDNLKPSEIYNELIQAVSKLNSAGYKVVKDDIEKYV